jgi:RimJ/RimL family protein N-acetyltransferase
VPLGAGAPSLANWRTGLPLLHGSVVTLRELRHEDAAALFSALASHEANRYLSPPPSTVEGFACFIAWSVRQREAGQYACFAVVPRDSDTAIGLFQIRSLEPDFGNAEWGFAIAPEYWGTGAFVDAARLVIRFAFEVIGSRRLEARAALPNERGNNALKKLGALREGVLRKSFLRHGEFHDQSLWTLHADDWRQLQVARESPVIH